MGAHIQRRALQDPHSEKLLARRALGRISAIAFLAASGAIHTAQIAVHLAEWNVAGLFFIGSAAGQWGLAIALTRRVDWRARDVRGLVRSFSSLPARKLVIGVVATSLTLILTWAASRAFGIPFGPNAGMPEPVDRPDLLATILELLTLAALAPLLSRGPARRTSWAPRRVHTVALAVLLLSTLATTAVALQPVTCERGLNAASTQRSSEKGKVNEAAVAALLGHANAGKHSDERKERRKPDPHATSDIPSDECH